jgi:hypothetical protein
MLYLPNADAPAEPGQKHGTVGIGAAVGTKLLATSV